MVIDWNKMTREQAIAILQLAFVGLRNKQYKEMTQVEASLYNAVSPFERVQDKSNDRTTILHTNCNI